MEINFEENPFDLDFHPSNQLVAAGLINGKLLLHRYAADSKPQNQTFEKMVCGGEVGPTLLKVLEVDAHSESIRAVRFINEGHAILTGSPDCSILATDVETGSAVARLENSHEVAVNRLVNLTETTIASGDDGGCIKVLSMLAFTAKQNVNHDLDAVVWDTRQRSCSNSFHVHDEYITDITFAPDYMKLLCTSGDGTLSVCNLRSNKVQTRSEFSEEELFSIVIMKNGRKVVCGTQNGTLLLYSWGFFKDCSDRFTDLCPNPVNALLKLDEDRIFTGSENGIISLVGILPNRVIQPIAEHSDYPVERLAFSHDRKYLGSTSHDSTIKLWDLEELLQGPGKNDTMAVEDSDSDGMDVEPSLPKSTKGTKRKNAGGGQANGSSSAFFADLS